MVSPSAPSLRARVFAWLDVHPALPFKELHAEFPQAKRSYLDSCKSEWKARKIKALKDAERAQRKHKGKRVQLVPVVVEGQKLTNSPPPALSLKLTREEAKTRLIERLCTAEDKNFAPMFKILLDYFPPQDSREVEVPVYERPPMLYPTQIAIVDAIQDTPTRVIVVEGDRRTGKTSACFTGCVENVVNGDRPIVDLWASKGDAARRILNDLCTIDVTAPYVSPLIASRTSREVRFRVNKGRLTIHDTTVADSKGIAGTIIWITEFDQVLRSNPIVVASIAGILRDRKDMKILLDMNKPTGESPGDVAAYNDLKKDLHVLEASGAVKFFVLEKKDVTHITEESDAVARALMVGAAGDTYARAALENLDVHEKDLFSASAILDAYESAAMFATTCHEPPLDVVMGIDPGYTGLAVNVTYKYRNGMMRTMVSETLSGASMTEQQLMDRIFEYCKTHGVRHVFIENNSGGLWWIKNLKMQGINATASDFGGEATTIAKGSFIRVVKAVLDRREWVFESDELRRALGMYNPDEPRGKNSQHKAHVVDAAMHAIWKLTGGLTYLETDEMKKQPVSFTA